ncbi:hypothetical protein QOT17_017480 [Balamuthia mandrillaris]
MFPRMTGSGAGGCTAVGLAVFLLLLLSGVEGQTCERWNGEPALCARFPGYMGDEVYIFVPNGTTLAFQQFLVASTINVLGTAGMSFGGRDYCNSRYLMLTCATHLRPCETIRVEGQTNEDGEPATSVVPLPYPRQPCRDLCLEYRSEQCTAVAEQLGIPFGTGLYYPSGYAAPLSCINEMEFGGSFYVEGNTSVALAELLGEEEVPEGMEGLNHTLTCNQMSVESFGLFCEEPLVPDYDNNRCAFECPLPAYSEDKYDNIKTLQTTFGWLSWVGSLLVALSYGVHPSLRSFPANLILMTALATNIATFAIILPTFASYHDTWCGIDGAYLFPSVRLVGEEVALKFRMDELLAKSHLCSFQGFVLMFGFLSTTMWWVIISFNMFLTVYFGKKLPTSRMWVVGLQVTFHVVGWVVPFVLTLIPTAADRMAFGPGDTLYVLFLSSFSSFLFPCGCSSSIFLLFFFSSVLLLHPACSFFSFS